MALGFVRESEIEAGAAGEIERETRGYEPLDMHAAIH